MRGLTESDSELDQGITRRREALSLCLDHPRPDDEQPPTIQRPHCRRLMSSSRFVTTWMCCGPPARLPSPSAICRPINRVPSDQGPQHYRELVSRSCQGEDPDSECSWRFALTSGCHRATRSEYEEGNPCGRHASHGCRRRRATAPSAFKTRKVRRRERRTDIADSLSAAGDKLNRNSEIGRRLADSDSPAPGGPVTPGAPTAATARCSSRCRPRSSAPRRRRHHGRSRRGCRSP